MSFSLYLQGDLGAQGELLLQGSFSVWSSSKRERLLRLKPSQRHIFLYEKALIFCKHSKPQAHNKATYHFKRYLKVYFDIFTFVRITLFLNLNFIIHVILRNIADVADWFDGVGERRR